MTRLEPLAQAQWRVSSFCEDGEANGGTCVEVAALSDGRIAVRNSNHPDAGAVISPAPRWTPGSRASKPASSTTSPSRPDDSPEVGLRQSSPPHS